MKTRDKYLARHGSAWRYQREIPRDVAHLDGRKHVRIALGDVPVAEARLRRDMLAAADDRLWAALRSGESATTAWQAYEAQRALQEAIGFAHVETTDYRRMSDEERQALGKNMLRAFSLATGKAAARATDDEVAGFNPMHPAARAALPSAPPPPITIRDALRQHIDDEALANASKSPSQLRKWTERRERAVRNFVVVIGDLPMTEITRDHALRFHRHWRTRIVAEGLNSDMARKDFAVLRAVYAAHFDRLGEDRQNVFDRLTFPKTTDSDRQPFTPEQVRAIIAPDALPSLNDEARAILTVLAMTGARPSEIANLTTGCIHLDADVPHIEIAPRKDRQLKAKSSRRKIPLIGEALNAMRRHPKGFARYADKEDVLSATLMKSMKSGGFLKLGQSVYSLRHSFIDGLRAAGVGDDLRRAIVGHATNDAHSGYGKGFDLPTLRDAMAKATAALT
jgi:integrase